MNPMATVESEQEAIIKMMSELYIIQTVPYIIFKGGKIITSGVKWKSEE